MLHFLKANEKPNVSDIPAERSGAMEVTTPSNSLSNLQTSSTTCGFIQTGHVFLSTAVALFKGANSQYVKGCILLDSGS